MIEVRGLTKIFPGRDGDVTALSQVDLSVERGDIFGIIGMSGAGKSTLLRCLCGLESPTAGSVTIDGQPISAQQGAALRRSRRSIGVIFQGYNLLMQKNVFDNVALPLRLAGASRDNVRTAVERLLALVNLSDKARQYPAQLSGGQKQRVAIARALATDPAVLLCDEPTSALDSFTTSSVLELLRQINRELGVTIVIITHEIGVVRSICNKVAVIDEAHFVEQGFTDAVFARPESPVTRRLLGRVVA